VNDDRFRGSGFKDSGFWAKGSRRKVEGSRLKAQRIKVKGKRQKLKGKRGYPCC